MTQLPRIPGSTLVLWLSQETVHDFILLFMPPYDPHLTLLATGSLDEAYLSSPHLEASPTTTFRACSSLAPTPVTPQPAPTIFSQESVHTTLSITHHTRKRPSTGPRTTHGPQLGRGKQNAHLTFALPGRPKFWIFESRTGLFWGLVSAIYWRQRMLLLSRYYCIGYPWLGTTHFVYVLLPLYWSTHPFVRRFDSPSTTWSWARHVAYYSIKATLEINTSLLSSIHSPSTTWSWAHHVHY
jgi:hypothetical protein